MSFWYGLEFNGVAEMPVAAIQAYLERLPVRQAELKLLLSDAASIPHMKENSRKMALNSWMKLVTMNQAQAVRPATPARLKMMGIGVRHVNAEPG